ncbi:MAG: hypothetical protein JNK21_02525 [Rhodospirillaceae bacterium]|nr:hypothetical protein [Rhodospirillaceae bacterium]
MKARALAGLCLFVLGACASGYDSLRTLKADADWRVEVLASPVAPSLLAYRAVPDAKDLWVYIEGDGRAWITPRQISTDPTPDNAVSLALARAPQNAAVAYIARPCQYLSELKSACDSRFWSLDRYGPEAVAQMNRAVDNVIQAQPGKRLILVGYSGGGVLAALLAAERRDVAGLVTLAANLDLAAWADYHKITPLSGSIDPVTRVNALARVPQVHVAGARDETVPPAIVEGFVKRLPNAASARALIEPAFSHACCWAEQWPRLQAEIASLLKQ